MDKHHCDNCDRWDVFNCKEDNFDKKKMIDDFIQIKKEQGYILPDEWLDKFKLHLMNLNDEDLIITFTNAFSEASLLLKNALDIFKEYGKIVIAFLAEEEIKSRNLYNERD